jgi:tetratricopeptide (TPR) repeat protein
MALTRRSSGSFVFATPHQHDSLLVLASGRVTKVRTAEPVEPLGRLLTDSGAIDRATLEQGLRAAQERNQRLGEALIQLDAVDRPVLERALREQLRRRLSWLAELPEESAFGFYADVDFLEDSPPCGSDPLSLIWHCLRDGRFPAPRQEAVLSALGARPLLLRTRAALDRFDLSPAERASIERLNVRPLALDALVADTGLSEGRARRLIYALLVTHQLLPQPLQSMPAPCASPSIAPDTATAAALRPSGALGPSSRPQTPSSRPQAPSSQPQVPSSWPQTPSSQPSSRSSMAPAPSTRSLQGPERVEHALERASRLVRERTRVEAAEESARAIEAAHAHIAKKQFADAERLAHAACKVDPSNAESLALHAWLRMQLGEHALPAGAVQIVAMLDRAVMKAPSSVPVRFYRAQVLKRLGRDEDAYKDFRFVARRAPEELDAVREVRLHLMRTRNKQQQSGVFSKFFLR